MAESLSVVLWVLGTLMDLWGAGHHRPSSPFGVRLFVAALWPLVILSVIPFRVYDSVCEARR